MSVLDKELLAAVEGCYQDPDIRERSYYPEFRRAWDGVFHRALNRPEPYFDFTAPRCYGVEYEFAGMELSFHVDQLKIYEWYQKELGNRKKVVFTGKKLKRDKKNGVLTFHEFICRYDKTAEEPALDENMKNIVAAAFPGIPVGMEIVYGSKWVEKRFTRLRPHSLDCFLIGTDYVPAFLGSAAEVALYLFLMDYCIIKTNLGKAKDEDIRPLLHIMRKSPMLQIKGLM